MNLNDEQFGFWRNTQQTFASTRPHSSSGDEREDVASARVSRSCTVSVNRRPSCRPGGRNPSLSFSCDILVIRAFREKGFVVIEFSDSGPGLQQPEKVFDPFYTTKPMGKGTGLGLSICCGVMQQHGGRISGFNRPEGGCTFRLEPPAVLAVFPQITATPAGRAAQAPSEPATPTATRSS